MKGNWEEDIALLHGKLHTHRKHDRCRDLVCTSKDNCDRLYDEATLQTLLELFLRWNLPKGLTLHCQPVSHKEQILTLVLQALVEKNIRREDLP